TRCYSVRGHLLCHSEHSVRSVVMIPVCKRHWFLLVSITALWIAGQPASQPLFGAAQAEEPTVETNDGDAEKADEKSKEEESEDARQLREFKELSDEIKAELEKRRQAADKGVEALAQIRQEFRDEFRDVCKQLREPPKDVSATDVNRQRLLNRQKILALHIWQSDAIEPLVATNAVATQDLSNRLHMFSSARISFMQKHQDKIQELHHLISTAQNEAMQRGMNRQNHDEIRRKQSYHYNLVELERELVDGVDSSDDDLIVAPTDHVLEAIQHALRRIVQLQWNGRQLTLNQAHWDEPFGGGSVAESRKLIIDRLAKQGFVMNQENHFSPFSHTMNQNSSSLLLLLENLLYHVMQPSNQAYGMSNSTNGTYGVFSFEVDRLRTRVEVTQTAFTMTLNEQLAPYRSVEISSHQDGRFRITVFGEQVTALIQQPNGTVRILESYDDKVLTASATSCVDLYAERTDFVEHFLEKLESIGIGRPTTRFDPPIADRVVRLLEVAEIDVEANFARLTADLDSLDYTKREAASQELARDVEAYAPRLEQLFEDDAASLELRSRAQRILEGYAKQQRGPDELVQELKLVDDPIYLANLLGKRPPEDFPRIASRLEKLTGQSLGNDPAAWRDWLAKQPRP
ncbi:MAG: hypothetical protein KDB23_19960, partial [Planctomycetales bacterium]|nr:hypothetical protein [Planctomycetales bacterium]